FGGAAAAGDIGIDQRLDSTGHVLGFKARPDDLADRSLFGGVAPQGNLVKLAALLFDAQNADMADMVVAASIDATGNLDLEIADFGLTLRFGEFARDFLRDRDRAGIGQGTEIEAGAADHVGDEPSIAVGQTGSNQRVID